MGVKKRRKGLKRRMKKKKRTAGKQLKQMGEESIFSGLLSSLRNVAKPPRVRNPRKPLKPAPRGRTALLIRQNKFRPIYSLGGDHEGNADT